MREIKLIIVACLLLSACGGMEKEQQDVQREALATTQFSDAVAVSKRSAEGVVTELRTTEGELVARAVIADGKEDGQLSLMQSESIPLTISSTIPIEQVHELIYQSWLGVVDAALRPDGEREYGTRCFIGKTPKIELKCRKTYCKFPKPYQNSGGVAGIGCVTKSQCRAKATACGTSKYYWYCGWIASRRYGHCGWIHQCPKNTFWLNNIGCAPNVLGKCVLGVRYQGASNIRIFRNFNATPATCKAKADGYFRNRYKCGAKIAGNTVVYQEAKWNNGRFMSRNCK